MSDLLKLTSVISSFFSPFNLCLSTLILYIVFVIFQYLNASYSLRLPFISNQLLSAVLAVLLRL